MRPPTIFVINPGSTSTKIALYRGRRCAWDIEVKHVQAELANCPTIIAQDQVRRER